MTTEECREHIGEHVLYWPRHALTRCAGTLTSTTACCGYVQFSGEACSKPCPCEDLILVSQEAWAAAEAAVDAADFAEWAAEMAGQR